MNDDAADGVRQWLQKAESDWQTVEILSAHERCPRDVVCFHCQQYVEKLLKALLTLHGIEAPKTHSLRRLIQLALPVAPPLAGLADASDALTVHGVATRYPDSARTIDPSEMQQAIDLAEQFASLIQPLLKP